MRRRGIDPLGLAFLDAITCGFGAVVLFFMIVQSSAGQRVERTTHDLRAEADRLELEVLDGHREMVETRNAVRETGERLDEARNLALRLLDEVSRMRQDLARGEQETLARKAHVERLKADLQSLEEGARRLSAAAPSPDEPGDRLRAFVGDGDRQYLTGLKVGGQRILVLVDSSASMLDETIVNIIRRRNLPDERKILSDKWRRALSTVDWLTTQLPRSSRFQIYTFDEEARAVLADTQGQWLDAGEREVLDRAVAALRRVVPGGGTNLYRGLVAARALRPPPDNLILLVDGLPTQGRSASRRATVSGAQRERLFEEAIDELGRGIPVNVILFPMEGDPEAAGALWKLAVATRGSFLHPAQDWP